MRVRSIEEIDAEISETIRKHNEAYRMAEPRNGPHCYGWLYPQYVPVMNECTRHLDNLWLERNRSKMKEWEQRAGIKKG